MKLCIEDVLDALKQKRRKLQENIAKLETGQQQHKSRVAALKQTISDYKKQLKEEQERGPRPFKMSEYAPEVAKLLEVDRAIAMLEMTPEETINVKAGDFISKLL